MLHLPDLYALDRLDLTGWSSIDTAAQQRIGDVLSRLDDPDYDRSLGLYGKQLLGGASPARLAWSVVLYERGADRNYLRIHADSLNEPFDINSGAKLQLGSTAKLRTLITYLDIVDALHRRLRVLAARRLPAIATRRQRTTRSPRWAAGLAGECQGTAVCRRCSTRRCSAPIRRAPGTYFTGGGMQSFANFEKWERPRAPTVAAAFANSINNAFVRLMRDIVSYEIAAGRDPGQRIAERP